MAGLPLNVRGTPLTPMPATLPLVRRLALTLPDVEEHSCYGTPGFYVGGKLFLRWRDEDETLAVAHPKATRETLIERHPDVFSVTEHFRNYDYVRLDLAAVGEPLLRETIESAWRWRAGKKRVAAFDAARPAQRAPRARPSEA